MTHATLRLKGQYKGVMEQSVELLPFTVIKGKESAIQTFFQVAYLFDNAPTLFRTYYERGEAIWETALRIINGIQGRNALQGVTSDTVTFEWRHTRKWGLSLYKKRSPRCYPFRGFESDIISWISLPTPPKSSAVLLSDSWHSPMADRELSKIHSCNEQGSVLQKFDALTNEYLGVTFRWQEGQWEPRGGMPPEYDTERTKKKISAIKSVLCSRHDVTLYVEDAGIPVDLQVALFEMLLTQGNRVVASCSNKEFYEIAASLLKKFSGDEGWYDT